MFDPSLAIQRSAIFSECRTYRYTLLRKYPCLPPGAAAAREGRILWILLNPSTADEYTDDPTNSRVAHYSLKWGFKEIQTVNLFAIRGPDPRIIREVVDPVGPENDKYIQREIERAQVIVCGWGNHGSYQARYAEVQDMLADVMVPVVCLGVTKSNQPKHLSPRNTDLPEKPIRYEW